MCVCVYMSVYRERETVGVGERYRHTLPNTHTYIHTQLLFPQIEEERERDGEEKLNIQIYEEGAA